jgi:hypothetical protein
MRDLARSTTARDTLSTTVHRLQISPLRQQIRPAKFHSGLGEHVQFVKFTLLYTQSTIYMQFRGTVNRTGCLSTRALGKQPCNQPV